MPTLFPEHEIFEIFELFVKPRSIPKNRLPVVAAKTTLEKAPISISPSSAIFNTPASSVNKPPIAARTNGVMILIALKMSFENILSDSSLQPTHKSM